MNHDRALRIGKVAMLYTSREGWWECDFGLDRDAPEDIEFEVGQPVSVGIQQLKIGSCGTSLREVSIVRHGAVKGAQITRRFEIEPKPAPVVKPATGSPPPVRTNSDPAGGGDTYDYRPPVWDELERIVGYRITDENQHQAFVEASRSPLDRLYGEHMAAKRQLEPAVIVRHGIGQVLAVR